MDSFFITPPDFVDNGNTNVLFIDVGDTFVATLMQMCQTSIDGYNIYLYHSDMNHDENSSWINKAVELSHAIILDPTDSSLSSLKNELRKLNKTFVYGYNVSEDDLNIISNPISYFIKGNNVREATKT